MRSTSIFLNQREHLHLLDQWTEPSVYTHVRRRESSAKFCCSIESAMGRSGSNPNESGHSEAWGPKEGIGSVRSEFFRVLGFPVMSKRIVKKFFFFSMGCIGLAAKCCRRKLSAGRRRVRPQKASS